MNRIITLPLAALTLALAACGGGDPEPTAEPAMPLTYFTCNGTPERIVIFLHDTGGDYRNTTDNEAVRHAPNACIAGPTWTEETAQFYIAAAIRVTRDYHPELVRIQFVTVGAGTAQAHIYADSHPGTVESIDQL